MSKQTVFAALAVLIGNPLTLQAQSERLAVGAMGGTLGLGGELTVRVLSDINARVGGGFLDFDISGECADIEYDFSLDMLAFPVRVDWYPFETSFHVSTGIVLNHTDANLRNKADATLTIGGTPYRVEDFGTLSGDISFNKVAPYIGIGWGNAFGKSRRWGFISDLGVAYTGSPNVALSATGLLASDPGFQADLAREQADFQDDLGRFKFYPVLSATLYFRF